jgi:hypothetical protein
MRDQGQQASKVLLGALAAPLLFAIARKLTPGQPVYWDALGCVVFSVVGAVSLYYSRHTVNSTISCVIWIWLLFQFLYALPGVVAVPYFPLFAFTIQAGPMLMIYAGYRGVRCVEDLDRISFAGSLLAIALLPAGFLVLCGKSDYLPAVLRANDTLIEQSGDLRAGIPAFAGPFSTQAVASLTFLSIAILIGASILARTSRNTHWRSPLLWTGFASCGALIYVSTRRGALLVYGITTIGMVLSLRHNRVRAIIMLVLIAMLGAIMVRIGDSGSLNTGAEIGNRSELAKELDLGSRFGDVFLAFVRDWIGRSPFGSYLGNYSQAGNWCHTDIYYNSWAYVEVGAAELVAELGIAGLLLMPFVLLVIYRKIWVMTKGNVNAPCIRLMLVGAAGLFILYYCKEASAFTAGYIHYGLFWCIPGFCLGIVHGNNYDRCIQRNVRLR